MKKIPTWQIFISNHTWMKMSRFSCPTKQPSPYPQYVQTHTKNNHQQKYITLRHEQGALTILALDVWNELLQVRGLIPPLPPRHGLIPPLPPPHEQGLSLPRMLEWATLSTPCCALTPCPKATGQGQCKIYFYTKMTKHCVKWMKVLSCWQQTYNTILYIYVV